MKGQRAIFSFRGRMCINNVHCVSKKNDTDVEHYNYDIHEGILIIFGRNVTKKISN